jgi:hypothetical protein
MGRLSRPAPAAHHGRPSCLLAVLLATVAVLVVLGGADARDAAAAQGINPFVQRGGPLHDSESGKSFGTSVAISTDGSTAVVGAPGAAGGVGAAWVFTRSVSGWVERARLSGGGESGAGQFGASVAVSGDGATVLVGAPYNGGAVGGVWVFTRSGGTWSQQGPALSSSEEVGPGQLGSSVALSADGNTALVGAWQDNHEVGAAWVFARSGESWAQQGPKLLGSGGCGLPTLGNAVALSADGNTALVAGFYDCDVGAVWTFTRSGSTWTQLGSKLRASGEIGKGFFGSSLGLSADGETLVVGADEDNANAGAAWAYTRSGSSWAQQGGKLTGAGERGQGYFGAGIALSADGNTALIGGKHETTGFDGAAWTFTRSASTWTENAGKLTGGGEGSEPLQLFGSGGFGASVALSGDAHLALVGGGHTSGLVGGVWTFVNEPGATPAAAEFGRCVRFASGSALSTGSYSKAGCSTLGGKHEYEWFAGPLSARFAVAAEPGAGLSLETVRGIKLTCASLAGGGEYSGNGLSSVGGVALALKGCALRGASCSSAGAADGEVLSDTLEGALGITKLGGSSANNKVGLSLLPAAGGGLIAQFSCGASTVSIRGSVIAPIPAGAMLSAYGLRYKAKKGRQEPERFVGGAPSVLEVSLDGGAFEQAGLTLQATLRPEEPLEVNPAFSETCGPPAPTATRAPGKRHGQRKPAVRHGRVCAGAVRTKKASCSNQKGHAHAGAAAVARCKKSKA